MYGLFTPNPLSSNLYTKKIDTEDANFELHLPGMLNVSSPWKGDMFIVDENLMMSMPADMLLARPKHHVFYA